jgi:hypothetical protein
MGYLDNSSITVDAVVTKRMRRNMALGQSVDIKYFCLSDTGVDYTLYNENHPSGSNSYGEAIEGMPVLEASAHASHTLLNKLITLDRNTTFLPTIIGVEGTYPFEGRKTSAKVEPQIWPRGTVQGAEFLLLWSDDTLLNVENCKKVGTYDEWILPHLAIENIERVGACIGTHFVITPADVTEAHSVNVLFMESSLGIWKTSTITFDANEDVVFKDIELSIGADAGRHMGDPK